MALSSALQTMVKPGGQYELGMGEWIAGFDGQEKRVKGLTFKRSCHTLREMYDRAVANYATRIFVVFRNERYTFLQFWKRASALARALQADFGVKPGERVGVCMRNLPEWMEGFVAVTAMGSVVVPLNSLWKGHELEYGIKDSGCKVVLCDERRYETLKPFLPQLDSKFILVRPTKPAEGVPLYTEILAKFMGSPMPTSNPLPFDMTGIMYTSGTTGHPKGVVHNNIGVTSMITTASMMEDLQRAAFPNAPQGAMLLPVPLFHVTASHHVFLSSLVAGKKIVVMERWDAGLALKLIERERVTGFTGVPTMTQDMMEHPDFHKTDVSSMQMVVAGGAPVPRSQAEKTGRKFKNAVPGQGYGLTETNGGIASNTGEEYVKRPGSTGKPAPWVQALVVDVDSTKVLKTGERGELCLRGCTNFVKYWNKEESTNAALVEIPGHGPGWFRTGDIVELDSEGYIYIKDRAKDIIIRGGENISCAEVESAFFQATPGIMEVSCFGLKHQRLGEEVGLLVHPKAGLQLSPHELIDNVRKGKVLADFKIPRHHNIFFTDKPLPRGDTGKILKRAIRDHYNKQRAANPSKL